jgi:hypothetical protein
MAWNLLFSDVYAVNENINISMFGVKRATPSDSNALFWIAGFALVIIALIFVAKWLNAKRIRRSNQRYLRKRAQAQLQEIELSEDASFRLVSLAKSVDTVPEKLFSSNVAFEKAVKKLKRVSSSNPLLLKIPGLREDLGYIFFNRRAQFICTQMLQSGQKLRIGVTFKGKSHSYVGTILNTTEDEFWVKPPTVKGKTVNLSKFKSFEFSIFRKNDGEYQFTCRLKSQITKPVNALVMEHSSSIKKLATREHDRYLLQFKRKFYFLLSQRKGKTGSDLESGEHCTGTVIDISIGGLKFMVSELPDRVTEGIHVVFKLEEAKIKKEINAEIVKIASDSKGSYIHLQFEDLSELNRLYLQKFIASKNPIKVK